ncbi:MAG: hypothetical protein NC349_04605 [Paenibacillus sp.]|nr:hypothetical protein [Paenibacillus sp.]
MLKAQSADGEISLSWNVAPEGLLKAIHVTNQTTGEKIDLPGNAGTVSFTGLRNYEKYTFLVKTESQQEQLSYGVTISAKPFKHDSTKPGKIKDLQIFTMDNETAYVVWNAPGDEDVENYILQLGTSSVSVSADYTFGTIRGDMSKELSVTAVDYSGNVGEATSSSEREPLLEILGWDTGDTEATTNAVENVRILRNPKATRIDRYIIDYTLSGIGHSVDSPEPDYEFSFEMNKLNGMKLWYDNEKTIGNWTIPIVVSLYSDDVLIGDFEYRTYNNIPGTLMLDHCNYITGGKQNNDGKCYDCVLGNTENNGYATFDINVLEDGDYDVVTWFSNGDINKEFQFYLDDKIGNDYKLVSGVSPDYKGTEGFKTEGGWNDYRPAKGVVTMHLTKGIHKLAFRWPEGGHNFKKLVFTKKV